jgi:uncharacterized protein with PIN domain
MLKQSGLRLNVSYYSLLVSANADIGRAIALLDELSADKVDVDASRALLDRGRVREIGRGVRARMDLLGVCLFYAVASCYGPRATFHRQFTHCASPSSRAKRS